MFNNIRHLRYVVQVARSGSLLEAARDLMISESAVSAAIKSVESEIGYAVFIRQPSRPLSLTNMGAEFIAEAQAFIEAAETFHQRARGLGTEVSGTVRLACAAAFAPVVLPVVLRACARDVPNVRLDISELDLPELIGQLRCGTADIGITYNLLHDSEIAMEPVVRVAPHVGVCREDALAGRTEVSLAELAARDMILIDHQVTKQYILGLFARHDVAPRILCQPRTVETMHAMISSRLGYGIFFVKPADTRHSAACLARIAIADPVPGPRPRAGMAQDNAAAGTHRRRPRRVPPRDRCAREPHINAQGQHAPDCRRRGGRAALLKV